jgi:MFS transporter, DHA1 family, tetracycline resistance protein
MSNNRSASMIFIFITILLDVIGVGLIIPVLPKLITTFCNGSKTEAAIYVGILSGVYALMQFLFAPVIGALSDQYGRRPVLLLSMFAFGLDYILLGFAPNIGWLFIGRVLAGITGASFTTANAYIADISTPETRAQNFGMVGAAFGMGFIIGPVIGGFLAAYGQSVPFFTAAALTLINWLYGYFVLPESLKPENRRKFDWKRANPAGALIQLQKYPQIFGILAAVICLFLGGQVHPTTWPLYTMSRFNFSEKEVGFSLAFVGLMIGFVQGFLIRKTTPLFGIHKSIVIGLLAYIVGFFLFSIADQWWMMYAFMIPFSLGGLATPNLQAALTSQIPPTEQGELQGALAAIQALTAFFGAILHSNLFSYFSSDKAPIYFPGAAFLIGSILSVVSLIIYMNSRLKRELIEKDLVEKGALK